MKIIRINMMKLLIFIFPILLFASANAYNLQNDEIGNRNVALLPAFVYGISNESKNSIEASLFEQLSKNDKFELISQKHCDSLFRREKYVFTQNCNYTICLIEAGRVLNASKVIYTSVVYNNNKYNSHVRVISLEKETVLFDERSEFSGSFEDYLNLELQKITDRLLKKELKKDLDWIVPVIAVGILSASIYLIYHSLKSKQISGDANGGGSFTPQ